MVPCWGRGTDLKKAGKKIWNQSVEDIKCQANFLPNLVSDGK